VSTSGVLLSSAFFDSSGGAGDNAFGAAPANAASSAFWVTGAVGLAGGNDELGLWRYDATSGMLTLTSTYSGPGGNDAGYGVAVDTMGAVWVVGFSSDTAATTSNPLDLALWGFGPTGTQLVSGPVTWPGFGRNIGGDLAASMTYEQGAFSIAASRLNALGNYDVDYLREDSSGFILSEQFWHGAAGSNDVPTALSATAAGGANVVGQTDIGGFSTLGYWSYDQTGALQSAQTIAGVGPARAIAYSAGSGWLATTTSSAPVPLNGLAQLAGGNGLEGSSSPELITTLLTIPAGAATEKIGGVTYVAPNDLLSLQAQEQSLDVQVPPPGIAATFFYVDTPPDSCTAPHDVTAPPGTCANPVYDNNPFTLSLGTHTVYYFSIDQTGNEEPLEQESFTVRADTEPPRTSLVFAPPFFSSGTLTYVSANNLESFLSIDDYLAVGDGFGSSVVVNYSVDGAAFQAANGQFFLSPEGLHTIRFYGVDASGNTEVMHSSTVAADFTPPKTTLQILGPSTTDNLGFTLVSSGTAFSMTAVDPVSNGIASGVAATYYVVDVDPFSPACEATPLDPTAPNGTCANEIYDGTFTLPVGGHTIYYFSEDNAGNQEEERAFVVAVQGAPDVLPPRTSLVIGAPSFSSGTLTYVSPATPLTLSAVDDLSTVGDGLGIGVAASYFSIDFASFRRLSSVGQILPPYLAFGGMQFEGLNTISFYSVDYDNNVEVAKSSTVALDDTPPITTLQVLGPNTTDSSGNTDISATTPITLSAVDPISGGVASGVAETYYVIDVDPFSSDCLLTPLDPTQPNGTCANEAYDGPFTLSGGTHTVYYFSEDNVGNQENETAVTFIVTPVDVLPPRTTLNSGSPSYSSGTVTYATAATTFTLTAVDDLSVIGDGLGVGVAATYLALDTTAYSLYAGPFSIAAEGLHAVSFYSVDFDSNVEVAHSSSVAVDLTPPITTLQALGTSTTSVSGVITISSSVPLALSAVDPISNGVASGVAATFYVIDANPFSPACENTPLDPTQPNGTCANEVYDGAFTLAVGTHTVYYFSEDAVGNQEALNVASVTVSAPPADFLPPRTTLTLGAPYAYIIGESVVYVSSETSFTLTAVDDARVIGDGAGVGVANTYYSIDGSSYAVYTAPFYVVAEGTHTVSYYSVDLVGNTEIAQSTGVAVDNTPPVVSLYMSGNDVFITAYDPVVNDVASGVGEIFYQVDDATAPSVYVSSFTLAPGTHTVYYAADDNVDNGIDTYYANTVIIDTTPPTVTSDLPPSGYENSTTPALAISYADSGRGVNTASVMLTLDGVNVTSAAVVTASSVTYTPMGLSQGTHTLVLTLANLSGIVTSSTTTFVVDTIPPVTSLQVDGLTTSATSLVLISTDTLGFTSTDAVSGVAQTFYALDASTPIVYASAFSVSVGTHSLAFHSMDKAGNVEATHNVALSVRSVSVAPPTLTLAPPSGSTVTITTPTITAVYVDTVTGVNTAAFRLALDGVNVTTRAVITASSATFVPTSTLAQGTHVVTASVADFAGDVAYATSTFFLDSIPPVTSLQVDGLTAATTSLVIVTTDTIGFVAVDSGTGVAATLYSVSPATYSLVYSLPFSLALGTYTISYHSIDKAGNVETPRSAYVRVTSGTAVSPITLTISLRTRNFIIGDIIQVEGEVIDSLHTPTWNVSVAIGSAATSGFFQIGSGKGDADGTLATWATLAFFSSYYTVKLSASDAYGNFASSSTVLHLMTFREFAGLGLEAGGGPAQNPFGLLASYAFPNPARGGAAATFRLQLSAPADDVELRVYSPSGRQVVSASLGAPSTLDDGNGLGAQLTYDRVWNVGGTGNGVYRYTFVAHKAGQRDVVATGKVAVIR